MNLILVESSELNPNKQLTLNDARFQQIKNTHQSKQGDSVRIGEINGLMGQGVISSITDKEVRLNCTFDTAPPKKIPLKIVLALPRPKMIRRIFRSLAELGVSELIIINSYKVEKSFWKSPAIKEENIRSYLIEGLQQAKDTTLPAVNFHNLFKPFVEDRLPTLAKNSRKLIAHPGIGEPCPHSLDCPITLAIGPEGGFTSYEVEKFIDAGFDGIHLGPRILKVENAITTLTAKLYS